MSNPIPYPLSVLTNCHSRALGDWNTVTRPFLEALQPEYLSLMQGESDVAEGIARHMLTNFGTKIFYYSHRGDPPYTPQNAPFWWTLSPQDMVDEYSRVHDRVPGIYFEAFREHGVTFDFEEQRRFVDYCIQLIELGKQRGLTISVGGLPVGVLNPQHVALYAPLLEIADYFSLHEYPAVNYEWHDPSQPFPDTPFAIRDALHPDNWHDPRTLQTTPHSFINRIQPFRDYNAQHGLSFPIIWCSEAGVDNAQPFDAVREYLKATFGIAPFPGGGEHYTRYLDLRGFNSYRLVYESTGLSFDEYMYKVLDWVANFYVAKQYRSVHLFMWEYLYPDGLWSTTGFNVAEYRAVLIRHARDWRARQAAPPPIVVIPPVVIPPTPSIIDALPYLRGDGRQYNFSSSERMRAERDGNRWYQVKNYQWEEMWFDGDSIYRGIDTSPGNNEVYILWADAERDNYGGYWMPRHVQVGDMIERSAWVDFRHKDNGWPVASKPVYRHDSTLEVTALHDHMTFPSGIVLDDVLELRGVDNGGAFEAYFYARDYGLVMWKNLRGTDTYHITQDNVDAPPLERETLAWWEAMEKPTAPAPDEDTPTPPDTDGVVLELAQRIQALAQQLAENTDALIQLLADNDVG